MKRILIIEDDDSIAAIERDYLVLAGFEVDIAATGGDIVSYGAPVLPGAMFLLAYVHRDGKTIPVVGLPGCVMYAKRTIFDLILPRLMADDPVTADELAALGHGGLCLNCGVCIFPHCGFGK